MPDILGIDTSNYTTSAALLHQGKIIQSKKLLPVKKGQLGLRQSDAVFHHVRQLPEVLESFSFQDAEIDAVGASDRPCSREGSYMPCFLVGTGTARALAGVLRVPLYRFSHQQGHIAAVLFAAGRLKLLKERFLAFHVSGGTTEAVLVAPDSESVFSTEIVARSLDLKGGQAVDRVGGLLGLSFPAGRELEQLALKSSKRFHPRPSLKGADCSLSGIENQCAKMLKDGFGKEDVARFCLISIQAALEGMVRALFSVYGKLPLVFAGGVMSNSIIRKFMTETFGAIFAEPAFSADNAAGVAVLAALKRGVLS